MKNQRYCVEITHVKSGETRIHKSLDGDWDFWEESSIFQWTEGNYSCDCNRHLWFNRAKGIEPEDDGPCGDSEYFCPRAILEDGTVIILDQRASS